ncbi:unnamed protein product [Diatraea saccharalis]|uniref:FLYWCH-type domain-containing protein n=1 Tax=Diatraea saccharalis TaxID=40085 RepID=A0A9N9WAS5_9NEOP|nr:unnamed protein product [Diatraea saccharalis]
MARGGYSLRVDSYMYNRRQSARHNNLRWHCTWYHKGCTAVVVTTKDYKVVKFVHEHSHEPPRTYTACGVTFYSR